MSRPSSPGKSLSPWAIPLRVYARSSLSRNQAVLWNSKASQRKRSLIMTSPWLWMTRTTPLLMSTTLPTSLCAQRLRDIRIRYDSAIIASDLAVSNPHFKDVPLLTWKQYRNEYLDACLTLNGRGRHDKCSTCPKCQKANPTFRCQDCFGFALYCKTCISDHHRNEPLHFLEVRPPHPPISSWTEQMLI